MTPDDINDRCAILEADLDRAKESGNETERQRLGNEVYGRIRTVKAAIDANNLAPDHPAVMRFRKVVARTLCEIFGFDQEESEIILRGADKPPTAPKPPPPPS